MEEKLKQLMDDAVFMEKLAALSTPAEIAEALQAEGVSVSAQEIEQLMVSAPMGELDEASLDAVNGGLSLKTIINVIKSIPIKPISPIFPVRPVIGKK